MSRPSSSPHGPSATGLAALWAAVADSRAEELGRQARAAATGRDLLEGGRLPAYRIATPQARVPSLGPVSVPAPSEAGDDSLEPLAAPEGEVAVAIGLVQRAQAGDAEAFGELYDRYVDQVYR